MQSCGRDASCRSGRADELWGHPADEDVARFLGLSNVRDGRVVRPEAVQLTPAAGRSGDGVVESAVRQGPTVRVVVRLREGGELEAVVSSLEHPLPGDRVDVPGDHVDVAIDIATSTCPPARSAWPG